MIYFNIRNLCALIHTASAFSLQISENFIFDHRKQILVIKSLFKKEYYSPYVSPKFLHLNYINS